MDDSLSIIDVGKLAKPATVLVKKISDAIGGIARPYQIVRVAEAQAKAAKIRAISKIEISEIEERALRRLVVEESKKQNNIEAIIAKALPQVTEESKPQDVEDDWISNFFDKCRLISDEEMQKLWAKVLAGESNEPGKFSKRTVSLLASLDKADAMLFTRLCGFRTSIGPLIYDHDDKMYREQQLTFVNLSHLETIGLVKFDMGGFINEGMFPKGIVEYFDAGIYIEFRNPAVCQLDVGTIMLTSSGYQLAPLCDAKPVNGFVDYIRAMWKSFGCKTEPESSDNAVPTPG